MAVTSPKNHCRLGNSISPEVKFTMVFLKRNLVAVKLADIPKFGADLVSRLTRQHDLALYRSTAANAVTQLNATAV
jgi:hypothetical protein